MLVAPSEASWLVRLYAAVVAIDAEENREIIQKPLIWCLRNNSSLLGFPHLELPGSIRLYYVTPEGGEDNHRSCHSLRACYMHHFSLPLVVLLLLVFLGIFSRC